MRSSGFYGWRIVLAGFAVLLLGGAANALAPMAPWPSDATDLTTTAALMTLLAVGPLLDRFGPKRVMLAGLVLASTGLLLRGVVGHSRATDLVLTGLLGVGLGAGFELPVQTAAANWFIRRRSFALAVVVSAFVLGGAAIDHFESPSSWRATSIGLGAAILVVCLPLAFVFRQSPERYDLLPDGGPAAAGEPAFTLGEALRSKAFWLLVVAAALADFQGPALAAAHLRTAIDTHTNPIIPTAPLVIALAGSLWILFVGYLGDRFPKRYLLAIVILVQGASALLLMVAPGSAAQGSLYALTSRLGDGTWPLLLAITADYFGRKRFATITAVMLVLETVALPPLLWLEPSSLRTGYHLAFLVILLLAIATAAVFFFARPPGPRDTNLAAS